MSVCEWVNIWDGFEVVFGSFVSNFQSLPRHCVLKLDNHETIIKVKSIRASDVKVNTFNCPCPLKIEVSLKVSTVSR